MLIGFAHVSINDQTLVLQCNALKVVKSVGIFRFSGISSATRPVGSGGPPCRVVAHQHIGRDPEAGR